MRRTRWAILGVIAACVAVAWDRPASPPLEGAWQIVAVRRNGVVDESQVGAHLIFRHNAVRLRSAIRLEIDDGTS